MKKMGRKHRPYYRIVAIDIHQPRDGRVLEELGTYDTSVRDTEERVTLLPKRIKYWLSVGARPSEHVSVFLKKYLTKWEQKEAEAEAAKTAAPAEAAPATT
jgi:small subunit ribosomal protein S16